MALRYVQTVLFTSPTSIVFIWLIITAAFVGLYQFTAHKETYVFAVEKDGSPWKIYKTIICGGLIGVLVCAIPLIASVNWLITGFVIFILLCMRQGVTDAILGTYDSAKKHRLEQREKTKTSAAGTAGKKTETPPAG